VIGLFRIISTMLKSVGHLLIEIGEWIFNEGDNPFSGVMKPGQRRVVGRVSIGDRTWEVYDENLIIENGVLYAGYDKII